MANENETLDEISQRAEEFFSKNPKLLNEMEEEETIDEEVEEVEEEEDKDSDGGKKPKAAAQTPAGEGAPASLKTLKDLTGGRFSSVEEIDTFIKSQVEAKVEEVKEAFNNSRYETDLAKRIDELHQKGIKVDAKRLYEMSVDYSSIDVSDQSSAIDLYKKWLQVKDPEITQKEIDYELRSQFSSLLKPLPDSDDEDYEQAKQRRDDELIKLLRRAKQAKKELVENQNELQLPKEAGSLRSAATAEQAEKARRQVRQSVEAEIIQKPELTLEIDGETINYKLNDGEIKGALDGVSNLDKFFSRYKKSDGVTDFRALGEDRIFLDNKEKIMTVFAKNYAKVQINKLLNKVKGIPGNNGSATRSTKETRDERAERILREKGLLITD